MTRTRHNHTIQARRGAWAINRCSLSFFVLSFFTQLRNYSQNILRISPHLAWTDLTGQRDLNLVEPSCRLCSGTLSFDNPLAPSLCSRSHHLTYIIYFAPIQRTTPFQWLPASGYIFVPITTSIFKPWMTIAVSLGPLCPCL